MNFILAMIVFFMTILTNSAQAEGEITCTMTPLGGYKCSNGMHLLSKEEEEAEKAKQQAEKNRQAGRPDVPSGAALSKGEQVKGSGDDNRHVKTEREDEL
ncbi:MAG: hypothetical protein A2X86_02245 [Bdellovibrionales bacterium GWA2_49_15]|nr:MAG: hypothetical protein A2X86_02245 [Bdellovibrionales bacterium GWA2_49_15]